MLKSLGAATVGVALAGCSDNGDDAADDGNGTADDGDEPTATDGEEAAAVAEAAFTASLSDDGSIPGHQSSNSDGTGEATFEGTGEGSLEFEVPWENLEGAVNGVRGLVARDGAVVGQRGREGRLGNRCGFLAAGRGRLVAVADGAVAVVRSDRRCRPRRV